MWPTTQAELPDCPTYANRLAYERTMLGESGGTAALIKTKPEKGAPASAGCQPWPMALEIKKVNKVSVTVMDNWGNGGKELPAYRARSTN